MCRIARPQTALLFLLFTFFLTACGGDSSGTGGGGSDPVIDGPTEEDHAASLVSNQVSMVQENLPLSEAESILFNDNAFLDIVDFATKEAGSPVLNHATIVKDEAGSELIALEYQADAGEPAVVVRHCRDEDCVYAKLISSADRQFQWENASGQIPARLMLVPFLRRDIDESDPDSSAVISAVPDYLLEQRTGGVSASETFSYGELGFPETTLKKLQHKDAKSGNKLRIASTFGTTFDVSFDDFANEMKSSETKPEGYAETSALYHVNSNNLDHYFSTLSVKDSLVIYGHGDVSTSRKRAVGMTVSRVFNPYGSFHYNESKMLEKINENPNGGPGLVFFAGCETAGLLGTFDNKDGRVFLGFSKSIWNGRAAFVIKYFYRQWISGKTLKESIDAVNALRGMKGNRLEANASADLSLTIDDFVDKEEEMPEPDTGNCIDGIEITSIKNGNDGPTVFEPSPTEIAEADISVAGGIDSLIISWNFPVGATTLSVRGHDTPRVPGYNPSYSYGITGELDGKGGRHSFDPPVQYGDYGIPGTEVLPGSNMPSPLLTSPAGALVWYEVNASYWDVNLNSLNESSLGFTFCQ